MPKVYELAATIAHVLKWRKAKEELKGWPDVVNDSAIMLWTERKEWLEKELLPSGSGFDAGTFLDEARSSGKKLVFTTQFHHMKDGYYTRWTKHEVTITPNLMCAYDMKVSGSNHNGIKDYICDTFAHVLERNTDYPL